MSKPTCKCSRELRRDRFVSVQGTEVHVSWSCAECDARYVQVVGEVDFARAELQPPVVWTVEERIQSAG